MRSARDVEHVKVGRTHLEGKYMIEPYPLLVDRRMSRRLWGGNRLAGYLGIEAPEGGEPLAEAWQIYAGNQVHNGAYAGHTLGEVAKATGAWLLGTATVSRYGNSVPLLAKFIDAAQPLSIQVHPGDDYARKHEAASGHLGKAEAWYILAAQPGAQIIWGFSESMTPGRVRRAVIEGDLEEFVNRIPVEAGDVIYNPEGTVHAIGAGLFLFEIQQASDLTYRLYDYGRRGADGLERELHIDRALDVANLEGGRLAKVAPLELGNGRRLLVESPHFAMEAIEPDARTSLATSPASLEFLTVTKGKAAVDTPSGRVALDAGTSAVLPATLGEYALIGNAQILRCYVPVG
ncbi:MAG: type I phosphomannose isomerase catalytic subunit [Trueperaceae bacterium]